MLNNSTQVLSCKTPQNLWVKRLVNGKVSISSVQSVNHQPWTCQPSEELCQMPIGWQHFTIQKVLYSQTWRSCRSGLWERHKDTKDIKIVCSDKVPYLCLTAVCVEGRGYFWYLSCKTRMHVISSLGIIRDDTKSSLWQTLIYHLKCGKLLIQQDDKCWFTRLLGGSASFTTSGMFV